MDSVEKLKRSVRNYLICGASKRMVLKNTLDTLAQKLPDTVIFGGMLREFGLGNVREFVSDIDLVSFSNRQDIYEAIIQFSPVINKFGGFRFIAGDRLFDLWSFEDTWAFRHGLVVGTEFSDLLKTTFFNLDAAAFHIGKQTFLYSESYDLALSKRLLDVNLKENPYPARMAHRAIRMASEKDLNITSRLGYYILENSIGCKLDAISTLFVKKLEKHSFSKSGSFRFDLQTSLI